MKKLVAFALSLLVTANLSAQNKHVEFLGVPLDGTIQQFQNELTALGCSHDREASALLPKGITAFKGAYAGHDALLLVYNDEKTNIVYQAKVVITCHGEENCETVFNDINEKLQAEYGTLLSTKSIQFGHETYGYTIMTEQRVVIGDVGLFVTRDEHTPNEYLVQLQYTDSANMRNHEEQ